MTNTNKAMQELSRFSPEEALAILELVEEKNRKESFIKYWSPYEKQGQVIKSFTKDIKELYVLGGNRSGKTQIGAAIAVAFLLGKDYFKDEPGWEWVKDLPIPVGRPRSIWVVGLDFATCRDVIWGEKLIRGKQLPPYLPKNFEEQGGKILEGSYQIIAPDGSTLTCKSADSGREKFQGASVDLVWIDEEPDVSIYEECWQRTADCGGFILVTLTPLKDINSGVSQPWVKERVDESEAGNPDIKVVKLSALDNPYIPEKEKERLKAKWAGHPEERARLYGDFLQRSGLIYSMLNPNVHFITPTNIPRDVFRVACIDPAPTGATACVWAAIYPNPNDPKHGNVVVYREYKQSGLTVSEHAKNILAMNGGEPIDLWLADPHGANQRNAENHKTIAQLYRENGIPVRLAEVDEIYARQVSLEYFTAALNPTSREPWVKIHNNLYQIIGEIKNYVWDFYERGSRRGTSKDKPKKGNDDLTQCMQYIVGMRLRGKRVEKTTYSSEQLARMAQNNSYT